jgi:hypothetical protein
MWVLNTATGIVWKITGEGDTLPYLMAVF